MSGVELAFADLVLNSAEYGRQPRRSPRRYDSETIFQVLRNDDRFSSVVELIEKSDSLRDELDGNEKVTFFAPTNRAFKHLKEQIPEKGDNLRRRDGNLRREFA